MICWWYGIMEPLHVVVCNDGTVSLMYYKVDFLWWYGKIQYKRYVWVEYVVLVLHITALYIDH